MLRKSQPNFSRYLKKIETQAKKCFSNKKNVFLQISQNSEGNTCVGVSFLMKAWNLQRY